MAPRGSRYAGLGDVVDATLRDRPVIGTPLRLVPRVSGSYEHTVLDGDRLDRLATTYYGSPTRWWRICDANPEFLSPLELIGRGPRRTLRARLVAVPRDPPASLGDLATALEAKGWVHRWRVIEPDANSDDLHVSVTYHRHVLGDVDVLARIKEAGFDVLDVRDLGRTGTTLIVPADGAP